MAEAFRTQREVIRSAHPQVSFAAWGENCFRIVAEYRARFRGKRTVVSGAPVLVGSHRRWQQFKDINYSSTDFDRLGRDFSRDCEPFIKTGHIGGAKAQLFPQRRCVDFALKDKSMPTYEYECSGCGRHFDKFQDINDRPVKRCPECGGNARRLISAGAGVIIKGRSSSPGAENLCQTPQCLEQIRYQSLSGLAWLRFPGKLLSEFGHSL